VTDLRRRPAGEADRAWLDHLRRAANHDLFLATWGGWDEERHRRHFAECWAAGHISVVLLNDEPVGMIQVLERPGSLEVGEIQILPAHQNRGLGSRLVEGVIEEAIAKGLDVTLSTGLENDGAFRLYLRLGFEETGRSDTHVLMVRRADLGH
jgi:ribosomal protein S18 acetylase RimI-like enzyme